MPDNATILNNAPIACVLAGNDISKGQLFGSKLDPQLPQKIYATYTIIKKIYDIDPDYSGMTQCCLYLWELMGKYGIGAMAYTGGGGSISPITPDTMPDPYQFEVSASSFIVTGQSSKTISNFIGYNLIFVRNNIPQSTVDNGGSYYSWDRITGLFTCSPAAQATELFQLYPI